MNFELILPPMVKQVVESFARELESSGLEEPSPDWKPVYPGVFPYTAKELRSRTVDDFWQRLGPGFRSLFEPRLLFEGESFGTLACIAENPENWRAVLKQYGSEVLVDRLIEALKESRGKWGTVV